MSVMEDRVPGLWKNTPISAVIDLWVLHGGLKLGTVLEQMKLGDGEFRGLHCGGNDANYCLRALLLTAVRHIEATTEGTFVLQERAKLIEKVARDHIPSLRDGIEGDKTWWDYVKDVGETLDDLGTGWSDRIFDKGMESVSGGRDMQEAEKKEVK